jgi:sugar phosphate isomerase/epimerase
MPSPNGWEGLALDLREVPVLGVPVGFRIIVGIEVLMYSETPSNSSIFHMPSNRIQLLSSFRQTVHPPSQQPCNDRNGFADRRAFLCAGVVTSACFATNWSRNHAATFDEIGTTSNPPELKPRFGLVTYLWGKDMDVQTVIKACQHAGMTGVELRTEHRHAVEPSLSPEQRKVIRKQFQDSGIELIGYGSNCEFHSPKPEVLSANIKLCKDYIHLMHDCGGSGVKVKPNAFATGVPEEKTVEQIGRALNELAEYGQNYGQQIRLEVHGPKTSELHYVRDMFQFAEHKNAGVCWNCNSEDLLAPGLVANFEMVRKRFGQTLHVRELNHDDYPYQELFNLLLATEYQGWVLMEARTDPSDKFAAMKEQREVYDAMMQTAIASLPASAKAPTPQ